MAKRKRDCCCFANKSLRTEAKPCYKCANQNKNERKQVRERETGREEGARERESNIDRAKQS